MTRTQYLRQLLFLLFLFLAFLIVIGMLIFTGSGQAATNAPGGKKKLYTFTDESTIISQDEQFEGDVLLTDSRMTVEGVVFGDIYVNRGTVNLSSTARIFGNVYAYESIINKQDSARIGGDVLQFSLKKAITLEKIKCSDISGYQYPYRVLKQPVDTTMIATAETHSGDLVVLQHTLVVNGKVDGDVLVIAGHLIINDSAAVDGHIIQFDSDLTISGNPLVTGTIHPSLEPTHTTVEAPVIPPDEEIQRNVEDKYLKKNIRHRYDDIVRFMGDVTIERNEIISGDVVCMRGTITIEGEVHGDVVAIFGNIEMDSTAIVSGDVVSVGGEIHRAPGAEVSGDVVQTSWTGVRVNNGKEHVSVGLQGVNVGSCEKRKKRRWRHYKTNYHWDHEYDEESEESFMVRYNRVEGLFLGYRIPPHAWWSKERRAQLFGHIGYGFKNEKGRFQLGMNRWLFDTFRFTVGGEFHDLTDTEDHWVIPTFENSLAAFLLKEDFQDFYRRVGASGYVMQNFTEHFRIKAGYHKEKFTSMKSRSVWSLFGGRKVFRPNPIVDEWNIRSIRAEVGLDTRNDYDGPTQGWLIKVMGEFARRDLNPDEIVNFDRYLIDIRRFQPIGHGENIDFRLRAGSARGYLPLQYRFDLGGISTLRGYEFKEFADGDRMILGNLEYRIYGGGGLLDDIDLFDDLNLILFGDAGLVWNSESTVSAKKGFDNIEWADLYKSIGIGFSNYEGNVRLNIAKRLDDTDRNIVWTFRIKRPF